MQIIKVKNLRKEFNDKIVLNNLSFEVNQGEIFGFLGPSGAGKTTTIKILTSQLIQTSGEVKVLGKESYLSKKENFKNIGILTDNSGIYERLSIYDNLKLFAELNEVDEEVINQVLAQVNLLSDKDKTANEISKGMKQRLLIARAILHKPKLLFLDEPTSALDPGTALNIHKLLRQLNENGTTIFLTTHDMVEAEKLCHRVAFLNNGEIVEIGEPRNLRIKYSDNRISVQIKNQQGSIIVSNNEEGATNIYQWLLNGQLESIHSMEPDLEDIFIRLTGRDLSC